MGGFGWVFSWKSEWVFSGEPEVVVGGGGALDRVDAGRTVELGQHELGAAGQRRAVGDAAHEMERAALVEHARAAEPGIDGELGATDPVQEIASPRSVRFDR